MKELITEIKDEKSIHSILKKFGFETNYNKKLNENGTDIIALKNGESFLIEHKMAKINKTTKAYKIDNEINGDILIVTTPKGRSFILVNEKTSLTRTCRFLDAM